MHTSRRVIKLNLLTSVMCLCLAGTLAALELKLPLTNAGPFENGFQGHEINDLVGDTPQGLTVSIEDHYTKAPIDSAHVYLLHAGNVLDSAYTNSSGQAELMFTTTSSESETGPPALFSLGSNYPNPFQHETRVDLVLPVQQSVVAEVYNVLGQRVYRDDLQLEAGYHTITIALGYLPSGVYFLRMSGSDMETVKLLKTGHSPHGGGEVTIHPGRGTPPASMSKTGETGYSIRVEKDRYASLEVPFDPADPAPLDIPLVRNNEVRFEANDAGGAGLSALLTISRDGRSETVTTPGMLVLESAEYRVVAGTGDNTVLDDSFEVTSRDTTFRFTLMAHSSTASVAGYVYTEHGDAGQGFAVTAYRAGQQVTSTTAGADGSYAIVVPSDGIDNHISIIADGQSVQPAVFDPETYRGVSIAARILQPEAGGEYRMNFILRTEDPLTRPGGADSPADTITLSTPGGTVMISKIPTDLGIVGGSARTYSPTFMPDAFPGEFATRQMALESGLFSGGFASINLLQDNGGGTTRPIRELRDTDGNPVWVEIRFRLDREDWHVIRDGNRLSHLPGYIDRPDRIDAPLYYYDEEKGDWLLNASFGWLEDDRGLIPPSALEAIRDGSYERNVYMTGLVDHFTVFNLDYPSVNACFTGLLQDQDGDPVAFANINFQSAPPGPSRSFFANQIIATTDSLGAFQFRVPRTETGPSDDWNDNGIVDNYYAIGSYESPRLCSVANFGGVSGYRTPGFPEEDGCGSLGLLTVVLRQAKKVEFELTFLDVEKPDEPNYPLFASPPSFSLPNAARATLQDPRVPFMGDVWKCACDGGNGFSACNIEGSPNESGTARITIPVLDDDPLGPLDLIAFLPGQIAYHKSRPDLGDGAYEFADCNYATPETKKKETIRCEVELRGPPEVEIIQPLPTGTVNGQPVYAFLFDEMITLEASGVDVRGDTINPLDIFIWSNIARTGATIAQSRTAQRTAGAAFGVGQNRSILVDGFDFYGWPGEATLTGVQVAEVDLTISPDTLRLVPGATGALAAQVTGAVDTTATWTSGSLGVATVNAAGVVTAVSPGNAVITARSRADATRTATARVEVADLTAAFSVSPATGDSTTVFTFDAGASTGDIVAYTWDFGDGSTGTGEVVTHTYAATGSFSVTLVVTDTEGTTANTTKTVSTEPGPRAIFAATPERGNPPLAVFFDARGSTGNVASWSWDFGDGHGGSGDTLTHVYPDPGLFTATLTVEDAGGLANTDSTHIRVNQAPIASFTTTIGPGPLEITVNAVASEDPDGQIVSFNWDFGDGTVIENGDVVEHHEYAATALYEITLVVEDDDGATGTAVQSVDFDCSVVEGDVDVNNQAELAALAGVCEVTGSLRIENIQSGSLEPLQALARVGGDLQIRSNPGITSLLGLSGLRRIDAGLRVSDNPSLMNLMGLSNLTVIDGNVRIDENDALIDVSGLANLATVAGGFRLSDNPQLSQCLVGDLVDRLRAVDAIAGDIRTTGNENSEIVAGNVTINSSADLDALAGMCEVTGNLSIMNTTVTDLAALVSLRRVGTGLFVHNNSALSDLSGLDNLMSARDVSIRGNDALTSLTGLGSLNNPVGLSIQDNGALTDLTGLTSLTRWESGTLRIAENAGLLSLAGLESLTTGGGALWIQDNHSLTSLVALSNLTTVTFSMSVSGNASLTSLHGLGGITQMGSLDIRNNDALQDLFGLENLVEVGSNQFDNLIIQDNGALTSLAGLASLSTINGTLRIHGNAVLSDITALANLTVLAGLFIESNPALGSLSGLGNIDRVDGPLQIRFNGGLTNLAALASVKEVQQLTIDQNPLLSSLSGLSSLTRVENNLVITSNATLSSLAGLSGLDHAGTLRLQFNPSLTDLAGLENLSAGVSSVWIMSNASLSSIEALTGIGNAGSLTISGNPELTSLVGLENLSELSGSLQIESLPELTSLSALAKLTHIGGGLLVRQNGALTSLGLAGLGRIGQQMTIQTNLSLPHCLAEALRDQVLALNGIGGVITLNGNDETAVCE